MEIALSIPYQHIALVRFLFGLVLVCPLPFQAIVLNLNGLFHGLEMSENGNHVVISFGVVLWLEPFTYTRYLINIDVF